MTELGQAEPAAVAAEPSAPTGEPTAPEAKMFDSEGNFTENWTHLLKDATLHDDATLKTLKNIDALAGTHVMLRKKVGSNTVVVPSEGSPDVAWDEFYKAAGRPDTVADYNLSRPEGFPEEYYNQELATAAMELFHKIGISQKQADALFEFNNNNVLTMLEAQVGANTATMEELKAGLHREWGNAYEQRVHYGNLAVEQGTGGDEEFKLRVCNKFGNEPDFIRIMSNLGSKFVEHGAVDPSKIHIETPADIQTKIDEAMANKAYEPDFAQHGFTKEQHRNQVAVVEGLFKQKNKSTKSG